MAAPLHDHRPGTTVDPVARFFALESSTGTVQLERPALRVIAGGRDAALRYRQAPSVYRSRRLLVGVLVLVALVGAVLMARTIGVPGPSQTGAPAQTPAAQPAPPVGDAPGGLPASYVVQPGDTLWSIAGELDPRGDIRPLVDELAQRAGPGVLEAGSRLDLAGLGG